MSNDNGNNNNNKQTAGTKRKAENVDGDVDVDVDVDGTRDEEIGSLLLPSLYRLTEGIPRKELKLMVSEAKACEEALAQEIKELNDALATSNSTSSSSSSGPKQQQQQGAKKSSSVDIMLETEVTPPDRYFTVSALLGRLRDDLATPLPPNSVLPALRAQNGLLQPPPKKKKSSNTSNNNNTSNINNNNNNDAASAGNDISTLQKQKQILALDKNPEYTKEHTTNNQLLALWKKISTHRTSVVFRRPVNPKEAPGYTERILFPMDLSLIRKLIVARTIKSYKDLHIRTALICHNCVKYNGRESDYGLVTRDFEAMVDEFIIAAVMAESNKTAASSSSSTNKASGSEAAKSDAQPASVPSSTAVTKTEKEKKGDLGKTSTKSSGTDKK